MPANDGSEQDEREQRLLEMALEVAAKGHDLSNWLTVALGNLDLGIEGLTSPPDDLLRARIALQGAIRLLGDALHVPGRRQVECDVTAAVRTVVQLVRPLWERRGNVMLVADLEATPPAVIATGDLQRVVLNLLLNSLGALPEGGRISVTVRLQGGSVMVIVRDTGEGWCREPHEDGFLVLASNRAGGIGLGLPGSDLISRRAGGKLTVERDPAGGTIAILAVPVNGQSG